MLINIHVALLAITVAVLAVALPASSEQKEPAHIYNEVQTIQPLKVDGLPKLREKAEALVDDQIPERVFCGSPKQRTWKDIDVQNATIGKALASDKGWVGSEWTALLELWACESSWKTLVANYEGSGAYGIPQSLPASKMASHGEDYLVNPSTQIKWGLDYIANRYKSPSKALEFHYTMNWY